jgi:hypothetical protein
MGKELNDAFWAAFNDTDKLWAPSASPFRSKLLRISVPDVPFGSAGEAGKAAVDKLVGIVVNSRNLYHDSVPTRLQIVDVLSSILTEKMPSISRAR